MAAALSSGEERCVVASCHYLPDIFVQWEAVTAPEKLPSKTKGSEMRCSEAEITEASATIQTALFELLSRMLNLLSYDVYRMYIRCYICLSAVDARFCCLSLISTT